MKISVENLRGVKNVYHFPKNTPTGYPDLKKPTPKIGFGKNLSEKSLRPLFLLEKKSSSPFFSRKKPLSKKLLAALLFLPSKNRLYAKSSKQYMYLLYVSYVRRSRCDLSEGISCFSCDTQENIILQILFANNFGTFFWLDDGQQSICEFQDIRNQHKRSL